MPVMCMMGVSSGVVPVRRMLTRQAFETLSGAPRQQGRSLNFQTVTAHAGKAPVHRLPPLNSAPRS
jgi:hypothetical protein